VGSREGQPGAGRIGLMSTSEWGWLLLLCVCLLGLVQVSSGDESKWACLGVAVFVGSVAQFIILLPRTVPILMLCPAFFALQFVVGPWLQLWLPVIKQEYHIQQDLSGYMQYASIASLIFWIAVQLPMLTERRFQRLVPAELPEGFRNRLMVMYVLCLLTGAFVSKRMPGSLRFVFVLVSNLRFVAILTIILVDGLARRRLLVASCVLELMMALSRGMFHGVALWYISVFAAMSYRMGWSKRRAVLGVLAGSVMIYVLLMAKTEYRKYAWVGAYGVKRSALADMQMMFRFAWAAEFADLHAHAKVMHRVSQGWILSRIMTRVPEVVPYARGETLMRGVKASLLPRFLAPDKWRAGGKEYFPHFTGHSLERASMGLGILGEIYANFGPRGGLLGIGLYGLALGLTWRMWHVRSLKFPLFWAWFPFVMAIALKAETEVPFILNYCVKATVVMLGVVWIWPDFRRVLGLFKTP